MAEINIPSLLVGPILRRSTTDAVCIWLATRDQVLVSARLLDPSGSELAVSSDPDVVSVPLGERLYMHLITLRSTVPFPTGVVLSYDLTIGGSNLQALGLLNDDGIAYPGQALPGLILADPSAPPMPILHSSCRRPHAPGAEGLSRADSQVAKTVLDSTARPSALFLTGDQIYADDVSADLLPTLTEIGITLTGLDEQLPGVRTSVGNLSGKRRRDVVKKRAKFTTSEPDHHLLSFGEYAAMYCMVWGGVGWEDVRQGGTRTELNKMRSGLPSVRRLLANIPTYMLLDDHEVTDDWNLSASWARKVYRSPCGGRVVANGLAAYWAFQAWGNDPDAFDGEFISTISGYLNQSGQTDSATFDSTLMNFRTTGPQPTGWSYGAPTHPPALALDSRTRRKLHEALPAELMDASAMDSLASLASSVGADVSQPLLLLAAFPILGIPAIESLQRRASGVKPSAMVDEEPWFGHRGAYARLMNVLGALPARYLVTLSGDVHFAYSAHAELPITGGGTRSLVQLTAGPAKNQPPKPVRVFLRMFPPQADKDTIFYWDDTPHSPVYEDLRRDANANSLVGAPLRQKLRLIGEILNHSPVALTKKETSELRITTAPDRIVTSTMIAHGDVRQKGPVVMMANNTGHVSFADNDVTHTLLLVDGTDFSVTIAV